MSTETDKDKFLGLDRRFVDLRLELMTLASQVTEEESGTPASRRIAALLAERWRPYPPENVYGFKTHF